MPNSTSDKNKITRVPGTSNYAIKNNTVFRINQEEKALKTVCLCLFCGEKFGGDANGKCAIYCKNCRTKEQRDQMAKENEEILRKK